MITRWQPYMYIQGTTQTMVIGSSLLHQANTVQETMSTYTIQTSQATSILGSAFFSGMPYALIPLVKQTQPDQTDKKTNPPLPLPPHNPNPNPPIPQVPFRPRKHPFHPRRSHRPSHSPMALPR